MTSTQALPAGVQEWFLAPEFKTCYPYFVLWTDLLLGRAWMPAMPSMPTLFIYGTRKRMMFHTDRFLAELRERTDGSRSVALDCGHFLQAQKPDEVAAELTSFFEGRRTRSFHIPHEAEEASPEPDAARGEL